MMPSALLAIGLQLILPTAALVWLWRRHAAGWIDWLIGVVVALSAIVALSLVLPWLVVPWQARYVYVGAGVVLAARSWTRRSAERPFERTGGRRIIRLGVPGLLVAVAVSVSAFALAGRHLPDGPVVNLACPFQSGTYLVASGGSHPLVNGHMITLGPEPRFVPWRGQSYGVDFVEVDRFGRRASGLASSEPGDYFIHGQAVTAPCAGTVLSAANDRPEMMVPMRDPDRSKLAGNHVLLACDDVEVLLAHMLQSSVRAVVGQEVKVGELLGVVGNSGNTDEPHLHVSAQRRSTGQPLIGGNPVWLTIAGRFLVRNDRLTCNAS